MTRGIPSESSRMWRSSSCSCRDRPGWGGQRSPFRPHVRGIEDGGGPVQVPATGSAAGTRTTDRSKPAPTGPTSATGRTQRRRPRHDPRGAQRRRESGSVCGPNLLAFVRCRGRWRAASVLPRRRRGKPGWGPAPAARRRQCPGADTAGGRGRGRGPVWSWGITELRGPRTPDRYLLYLVIDVYSRYPITWCIEYPESAQRAVELFTATIGKHGPARAARRQRERRCARRDYWTCSRTKACSRRSRGPGQRRQPVLRVAVQDTQARPVLPAAVRLDRPRAPMDRRFPAPVFHRAPRDRIVRSVPCSPPGTVATGLSAVPSATSVRRRNRCRPTAASSS